MRFSYALMILGLTCPVAEAEDRPTSAAAIRKLVLDSWATLDSKIRSFRSQVTEEKHRAHNGNPSRLVSRQSWRTTLTSHRHFFESIRVDEPPSQFQYSEREISNDQYSAKMTKGKSGGEWVLSSHDKPNTLKPEHRRDIIFPWSALSHFQLTDWLLDPQVLITRVERPGGSIVRLHFSLKEGGKPVAEFARSGHFDFDEANHFCLTGHRINKKNPTSVSVETGECHYDTSKDIPVLTRAIIGVPEWRSEQHGTVTGSHIRTYETVYNGSISDDEFWLSHYGFPEPVGVIREKSTSRYWLLTATGAFLALAIGFRHLARRRAARGNATTIA